MAVNLARGADGRWTALHGAALYTHAKTGGFLYQAALRAELTRELGVQWGPVRKGAAEVVGVPRGVLEEFSQRRAEILERLAERGESSANAARHAALDTRRAKEYGVDASTIYERWQARAAEHGLTRRVIGEVLDRGDRERVGKVDRAHAALLMTGESGLTAQASTFGRREALQAWAQEHGHGGSVAQVEALADGWLQSELAIRVDGDGPPVRGDVIATAGGRRVAEVEDRFSTPSMLAAEQAVLARAKRGMNIGAGVTVEGATAAAIAKRPTLRSEQAAMVEQLTRSGHRVDAVRGLAGTGKTFALDAAAEAWRSSGLVVGGVTLSGKAADVLRDETGIPMQTIAKFLLDVDRYGGLARGQVLVVDGAGMVGTRDLGRLLDLVEHAEGKLVLVGDDHQLPEIDAGGAFRALVERQAGVQLEQVTRQRDPRAVAELAAIRAGRADEALASMAARGNLTMGADAERTRELMVRS